MESIQFGLALQYDSGQSAAVATNTHTAIEVHKSQVASDLWYHIGAIHGATVAWGKSTRYSSGYNPSVALNNANTVVEVHETSNLVTHSLYYKVGAVRGETIAWGTEEKYDSGLQPHVALNDNGVIVAVHKSQNFDTLYYRVGKLDGNAVSWGKSRKYDSGIMPAVSITNSGLVIEAHKSEWRDKLFYRVGQIKGEDIVWGNSTEYQDGTHPGIAVTENGKVVAIHESEGLTGLWQLTGVVKGNKIVWNPATNYDSGSTPVIGMSSDGTIAVQVHRGTGFGLWYSTSRLMDTANLIRDMLPVVQNVALRKMVLPATHDAGMYTSGMSALGQTQDLDFYGQLNAGARYFDLRPNGNLYICHGIIVGPPLEEILQDIQRFFNEGHTELIILKFSHFKDFNSDSYTAMKKKIQQYLGPWLFTHLPENTRLADLTMGQYLEWGSRIIVVVDSDWAINDPETGFWVYRDWDARDVAKAHLTVFDDYSNTMSYEKMKDDQLEKLAAFKGHCSHDSKVPCDLFLLSWTLTPPTAVRIYASDADRNLGNVLSYQQKNEAGYFANLLYLDYLEYARPAFIAAWLTKCYNATHNIPLPDKERQM